MSAPATPVRPRPVTVRAQALQVARLFDELTARLADEREALERAGADDDSTARSAALRQLSQTIGVAQALVRKADSTLTVAPQLDPDRALLVARAKLGRAVFAAIEGRAEAHRQRRDALL